MELQQALAQLQDIMLKNVYEKGGKQGVRELFSIAFEMQDADTVLNICTNYAHCFDDDEQDVIAELKEVMQLIVNEANAEQAMHEKASATVH